MRVIPYHYQGKVRKMATTEVPGVPDIKIGQEVVEAAPWLGQIVVDEWVPGEWGMQWHLAVKPVDFSIGGKTGSFHTYYTLPKGDTIRKNSKFGTVLEAMAQVFDKSVSIGQGVLVGQCAIWMRRDITFGKDKQGEPMVAEGVLVPVKKATAEESARATSGGPAPTPAQPEWTEEEIEQVLHVIGGLPAKDLTRAAARSELSPKLKNAVMSGVAVDYLTAQGLIELADGKVVLIEDAA
jgi:hypothetical protein